jgi:spore maturation protein CgeB
MKVASALSDVTFLTGMGYVARQLARAGGRNLVLMPNGCCQVRFSEPPRFGPEVPEFDVSFIGNRLSAQNPLGHFFWTARRRDHFVKLFTRRYGKRFALFGRGWEGNPCWLGPVPYAGQHQAYRRSAVVVGGTPNANHDYYSSDRVFIALASGVPLVDWWVPGLDRILVDGRDCRMAHDIADMVRLCDTLLEMPSGERQRMAAETRARILGAHTQYHRCRQMIDIVKHLRRARQQGSPAALPQLPFLGASAQSVEAPQAVMAWQG